MQCWFVLDCFISNFIFKVGIRVLTAITEVCLRLMSGLRIFGSGPGSGKRRSLLHLFVLLPYLCNPLSASESHLPSSPALHISFHFLIFLCVLSGLGSLSLSLSLSFSLSLWICLCHSSYFLRLCLFSHPNICFSIPLLSSLSSHHPSLYPVPSFLIPYLLVPTLSLLTSALRTFRGGEMLW